jgi:hypothetical protein
MHLGSFGVCVWTETDAVELAQCILVKIDMVPKLLFV